MLNTKDIEIIEKIQGLVRARLKGKAYNEKNINSTLEKLEPTIKLIRKRYGVKKENLANLSSYEEAIKINFEIEHQTKLVDSRAKKVLKITSKDRPLFGGVMATFSLDIPLSIRNSDKPIKYPQVEVIQKGKKALGNYKPTYGQDNFYTITEVELADKTRVMYRTALRPLIEDIVYSDLDIDRNLDNYQVSKLIKITLVVRHKIK